MSKKHRNHDQQVDAEAPPPVADVFPAELQADGVDNVPPSSAEKLAPSAAVEAPDDRYLRLAAEYDNFRKRTAKERMEMLPRAQGELLKRLIDPSTISRA